MSSFFSNRPPLQLAGDVAIGGLAGARNGVLGSLLLACAAGSSIPAIGTLGMVAGVSALGVAVTIIPVMIAYKRLGLEPENPAFLFEMSVLIRQLIFRAEYALLSADMLVLIGVGSLRVATACFTASFTLGVLDLMSYLIRRATSSCKLVGEMVNGALNGAKNGVLGSLLLASAAGSSIPAIGSLGAVAGACALGAALMIIPAILVYNKLVADPDGSSFLLHTTPTLVALRAGLAFASGCAGAAILGLAVVPLGLTCLSASLTLGVLDLINHLIADLTAPRLLPNDTYLAMRVTQ
ncbi:MULTISPECIES: hypothetical protein [unclassified Legionella]|uniref:hypothetical protein n=1 Tax=unclassified Legionella TaxID=2622702 RepID=UPI001E37053D|nr:hypothetical protein [Legionella sp. 31fI33]MCC5015389.1 hypothetical protein [Legionella sp. 31fI33]